MCIPVNEVKKHFKSERPVMSNITHKSDQWSPYHDNSGTVLAVGIPGSVLVAVDPRLSNGYNILTRDATKLSQLTDKCVQATAGQYADFIALRKFLQQRLQLYEFQNEVQQGFNTNCSSFAIQRTLFQKIFPLLHFQLIGSLDENNNGVVYGYDAIGSYDQMTYGVQGGGQLFQIINSKVTIKSIKLSLKLNKKIQISYQIASVVLLKETHTRVTMLKFLSSLLLVQRELLNLSKNRLLIGYL
ncbi:unnamed protein product [Paramecium octaurelia]|uniref:Proteasome subunit beta n=1 Tax=Paramecium octaurelia TaxID=43137 RepID=A0A8S1S843_PAROT|nr:unnamed protein product [Paramecium octaurelia]